MADNRKRSEVGQVDATVWFSKSQRKFNGYHFSEWVQNPVHGTLMRIKPVERLRGSLTTAKVALTRYESDFDTDVLLLDLTDRDVVNIIRGTSTRLLTRDSP